MTELEAEIRRGSTLTRQLLLFSRRETAKPERLDLNDGIRGAATFLRRLVRANIGFSLELADEPLPVEADRGQLDQVLMNLVVNAADAMPGGGSLTIRSGSGGLDGVWFAADDTGTGIPKEIRERIFEPFFTTKGTGTGLGLSVVHGIVTQHGGEVRFEDLPGGGTSFRVELPRAGSGDHPIVSTPTVETSSVPSGHGERILVVEDEDGARRGLVEILRMLEYDVVAVGSGEDAGLLPTDPGFDVLLTDSSPSRRSRSKAGTCTTCYCIWVHGYAKGRGNFQKRGMGKALLRAAEEDVRQLGGKGFVVWGLSCRSSCGLSWFRRQGYRRVDRDGVPGAAVEAVPGRGGPAPVDQAEE